MGELGIGYHADRGMRRDNVEQLVHHKLPQLPYTNSASAWILRQSGGKGQYGDAYIELAC